MPVSTGETTKGDHQCGEDQDEDDVRPECADKVHETEDTHPQLEETCHRGKGLVNGRSCPLRLTETGVKFKTVRASDLGRGKGIDGIVERCKSTTEGEPESA